VLLTGRAEVLILAAALMPSAGRKVLQNNPSNRSMNGIADSSPNHFGRELIL
jgi:hypothetical protein